MAHITIQYRQNGELHEATTETRDGADTLIAILRNRGADNFIKHIHGDVPDRYVDLDKERAKQRRPSQKQT